MIVRRRHFLLSLIASCPPLIAARAFAADSSMTPANSAAAFQDWLAIRRLTAAGLSVHELVRETLSFYQAVRCTGLAPGEHSDMLLYQWGVFNWGQGEHFEFDLTRQFIAAGKNDDDVISQLRVTAYFDPTEKLRDVKRGNYWCERVGEVEALRKFIENSGAYEAGTQVAPSRVDVHWSPV